jgi:hypothetical protein
LGHSETVPGYFLGGSLAPIGLSISYLATNVETVLDHLLAWRTRTGKRVERSDPRPLPECAAALDPLEAPWTTELVLDCGEWTAYLNNGISGGDPTAAAPYLSTALEVRCAVAMHSPPHGPGHAATQLWLLGPDGKLSAPVVSVHRFRFVSVHPFRSVSVHRFREFPYTPGQEARSADVR